MSHALAAARAPVLVVFHAGIPAAYHGFYGEAVAQHPVIAVGKTSAVEVAPVYDVLHARQEGYLPHVVVGVMSLQPEEVPFELAAGPVSQFRLQQVEVQLHVVAELPGIVGAVQCHCEMALDTDLHSCVGRGGPPQQQVGAQRHALGKGSAAEGAE